MSMTEQQLRDRYADSDDVYITSYPGMDAEPWAIMVYSPMMCDSKVLSEVFCLSSARNGILPFLKSIRSTRPAFNIILRWMSLMPIWSPLMTLFIPVILPCIFPRTISFIRTAPAKPSAERRKKAPRKPRSKDLATGLSRNGYQCIAYSQTAEVTGTCLFLL